MNGRALTRATLASQNPCDFDINAPAVPKKHRHEPVPEHFPEKRDIEGVIDVSATECIVLHPSYRFVAYVEGVVFYHIDGDSTLRATGRSCRVKK